MGGTADVEKAALAEVMLACVCVQGWRTLPGVCRAGVGLAFALGKGHVQHKCRWSHQDLSGQYVLHLPNLETVQII